VKLRRNKSRVRSKRISILHLVGAFDLGKGRFEVFAHFAEAPPRDALLALIELAANGVLRAPLHIEQIFDEDWVTLCRVSADLSKPGAFSFMAVMIVRECRIVCSPSRSTPGKPSARRIMRVRAAASPRSTTC
jgi:hypothetical protein